MTHGLRHWLRPAFLCALALQGGAVLAFERSDGVQVHCEVERNGERRIVPEIWTGHGGEGDRHPDLGGAAAVVRSDPDGWPVIYFDAVTMRGFRNNDPHMIDFIFYHECAHATDPARDEIEANCEAFLAMEGLGLMDEATAAAIAGTHRKWRRLPTRYGGSGEIFWDKTLACVDARRLLASRSRESSAE